MAHDHLFLQLFDSTIFMLCTLWALQRGHVWSRWMTHKRLLLWLESWQILGETNTDVVMRLVSWMRLWFILTDTFGPFKTMLLTSRCVIILTIFFVLSLIILSWLKMSIADIWGILRARAFWSYCYRTCVVRRILSLFALTTCLLSKFDHSLLSSGSIIGWIFTLIFGLLHLNHLVVL